MQRYLTLCFGFLIFALISIEGTSMGNIEIPTSVTCRDNVGCKFSGQDIFIDISIQNNTNGNLALPIAFWQQRGPVMKLTDRKTGRKTYARGNLADFELLPQFTTLLPRESAELEWVITAFELQQFNAISVDVDVEISLKLEGELNDEPVQVNCSETIRISGNDDKE
jgi:hypothetical protein